MNMSMVMNEQERPKPEQRSEQAVLEAEIKALRAQLQETQENLLQREKMAALGELMVGTAHEINTPLGAIQASIWNIHQSLGRSLNQLPSLFEQLSPELREDFQRLLLWAQEAKEPESTRAERKLRRQIRQSLEEIGIEQAEYFALSFSQMGIEQDWRLIQPLLNSSSAKFAIDTAYNIAALQSNSDNIQTAADRAAHIVSALKRYARRGEADQKKRVNITEGIDIALTLYHNKIKHGIEVVKEYKDTSEILCYPEELLQIWSNLIGNAIQAMSEKGIIRIVVSHDETYIQVQVSDSGSGILPEHQSQIFEPLFTTKPSGEGCGLGLAIVARIVAKHSGKVEVESEPGNTRFTVFLPFDSPCDSSCDSSCDSPGQ